MLIAILKFIALPELQETDWHLWGSAPDCFFSLFALYQYSDLHSKLSCGQCAGNPHLTLFSFLAQTLFYSSSRFSLYTSSKKSFFEPLSALRHLFLPICHVWSQWLFCPSPSLNLRAWRSGIVSCLLIFLLTSVLGTW